MVGVRIPDLRTTTLGLLALLHESVGAGELVRKSFGPVLPLQLTARTGSNAKTAIFETTPGITTPKVRVEIMQANPNIAELSFSAQIEGAVIQAPQGCGTAATGTVPLQTRFTLTSEARAPVEITTEQPWQCTGAQLQTP